jgi:hypothetical protein
MRMAWGKADKAPGRKREQKQRLARQQKRKDFAKNMERADEIAHKWYSGTYDLSIVPVYALADEFVDWAINRYRYLKHSDPMTKKHKNMHAQWNEILATAEACKKATDAHTYPKRRAQHKLAVAKFRADRMQSRIEAAQSIAAEMQAKKQERALR